MPDDGLAVDSGRNWECFFYSRPKWLIIIMLGTCFILINLVKNLIKYVHPGAYTINHDVIRLH